MRKAFIHRTNIISSLGKNTQENFAQLKRKITGIKPCEEGYFASKINDQSLIETHSLIFQKNTFTRLEKLMIASISDCLGELKVGPKTALIISSTKGNIDLLSEASDFPNKEKRVYLSETGKVLQTYFNLQNEPTILSNACVSGIQAIGIAKRMIQAGVCDEAIVVGGDLFSEFVYRGFESFQAISDEPCQPYSKNRKGITLGEAVGTVFVTNNRKNQTDIEIIGVGTANDANHISGPSRTGEGLYQSIKRAQSDANFPLNNVDFISAHGTATNYNDEMESIAFHRLELNDKPTHSLKGYYGHTLGAAGIIEAIIGIESLLQNTLIASKGFDELGTSQPMNIIRETEERELKTFLKTASGFGGCNTAVLFQKS